MLFVTVRDWVASSRSPLIVSRKASSNGLGRCELILARKVSMFRDSTLSQENALVEAIAPIVEDFLTNIHFLQRLLEYVLWINRDGCHIIGESPSSVAVPIGSSTLPMPTAASTFGMYFQLDATAAADICTGPAMAAATTPMMLSCVQRNWRSICTGIGARHEGNSVEIDGGCSRARALCASCLEALFCRRVGLMGNTRQVLSK